MSTINEKVAKLEDATKALKMIKSFREKAFASSTCDTNERAFSATTSLMARTLRTMADELDKEGA